MNLVKTFSGADGQRKFARLGRSKSFTGKLALVHAPMGIEGLLETAAEVIAGFAR